MINNSATVYYGDGLMSEIKKIISISSKRQITIPQKFFNDLCFTDYAECILGDGELVIRPIKSISVDDFSEQILRDLISRGLGGEELLNAFKDERAKIRPAVEAMLLDAKNAALGTGEFYTHEDVFGRKDD